MATWVTVFPNLCVAHLNKDVGLIPHIMQQQLGYNSYILTINSSLKTGTYNEHNVVNIARGKNERIAISKYIYKNAKTIQVLNLYHFSFLETLLWVLPYKIRNPRGKAYLKMDLSTKYMHDYTDNKVKLFLRRLLFGLYNLVSVESSVVCRFINRYYKGRVIVIPNGYYWANAKASISLSRKNEIIHVARMGADCKCTDVLIKGFEKSLLYHNWTLRLIGSMEHEFKIWYETKINDNPELKSRIFYDGEITNREVLADKYANAKIFAISSEYESFGIVLIEALSQGCYLIGTEGINSLADIVTNEDIGMICESNNSSRFSDCIIRAVRKIEAENQEAVYNRIEYAEKNYSWEVIVKKIEKYLRGGN